MKQTIHLDHFDLPRFIDAIVGFWNDEVPTMPAHEVAFAFVGDDGFADFGTDCLWNEADTVGDSPLEWLQHGQTLFAQFTRRFDGEYELADGTKWKEPDDEEDDDAYLDEHSTYGFLISLNGELIRIQSAMLRDVTGECRVTPVKTAGPFEKPMTRFFGSMLRKTEER